MQTTNTTISILAANETDIEELTRVEIESKKQSIPECIEDFEVNYSSRYAPWQTYFKGQSPQTSRPERLTLKAVTKKNKIIGYLAGQLTTRYNMDAEIQSFYVLKQEQKKEVGTRLLAEFVKWLSDLNAKTLCVGINPENKYKAFYLKHGGKYLNEHWIFWQDISSLLKEIDNTKKF
jgi:GNAT superfamily N-acetyltransferase